MAVLCTNLNFSFFQPFRQRAYKSARCTINNFEFFSEIPQESDGITYASKIQKSETRINWNLSGIVVDRLIRSLSEKPGAWCILNGSRVKILNSKYVKLYTGRKIAYRLGNMLKVL